MPENATLNNAEFRAAFLANEQQVRINTGKVACALVIALMPAGIVLDLAVYPDQLLRFLGYRLFCSLLAVGLFFLHKTRFGEKHYQYLGLPIALLPAAFISLMIHVKQ